MTVRSLIIVTDRSLVKFLLLLFYEIIYFVKVCPVDFKNCPEALNFKDFEGSDGASGSIQKSLETDGFKALQYFEDSGCLK